MSLLCLEQLIEQFLKYSYLLEYRRPWFEPSQSLAIHNTMDITLSNKLITTLVGELEFCSSEFSLGIPVI